MSIPVFQLVAKGALQIASGSHTIASRHVYTSREAALACKQAFIERCTTGGGLTDLDPTTIKVTVLELELEWGGQAGSVDIVKAP